MKKNWFYIISPCVLLAAFSIFMIISGYASIQESGGWSYIAVIIARNALFFTIAVDVIARLIIKRKALLLWIVELVAIAIFYFTYMRPYIG